MASQNSVRPSQLATINGTGSYRGNMPVKMLLGEESDRKFDDVVVVQPDPDPPPAEDDEADSGNRTTKLGTFANLVKSNIGTGILSLPYAMAKAGLVVGLVGMIGAGFLCTFCMHQLLSVYRKVGRNRPNKSLDYADVAEACFSDAASPRIRRLAPVAKFMTNFFLVFVQIGTCCVYLNFCPSMVKHVVERYTTISFGVVYYKAVTAALLVPYCFVRTLDILAIFSTIANFMAIGSVCVILQFVLRHLQPWDRLPLATNGGDFFMFFGSIMFAYESITFVLPFENKMKDRMAFHYWDGLMSLAMVFIIGIYTAFAFYGYLAFGTEAQMVLRNLPDHWVYDMVRIVYATSIFLSYGLMVYIPVEILWPPLKQKTTPETFFHSYGEYVLRAAIVVFSFILASSVPCLEQMIALVGSLATSSLALVFPPILEIVANLPDTGPQLPPNRNNIRLRTFGPKSALKPRPTVIQQLLHGSEQAQQPVEKKPVTKIAFGFIVFRGIVIACIGVAAMFVGTYMAIVDIRDELKAGSCTW